MPATTFKLPIATALTAVALAVWAPRAPASPAVVGEPAPALIAQSFRGEKFDLSTLRGKVVVLNFWASWCEPCRAEMPLLEALSHDYGDRVAVVGLSADDPHDRRDAVQLAQRVSYLTGLLVEAPANGFGAPQALPLTYIIAPTGILSAILQANLGPLSADRLRAAVETALHVTAPPGESP
jgi:cytochrome c biogenesis protein CcmG, thiol:disulfide interchange protein DsbE